MTGGGLKNRLRSAPILLYSDDWRAGESSVRLNPNQIQNAAQKSDEKLNQTQEVEPIQFLLESNDTPEENLVRLIRENTRDGRKFLFDAEETADESATTGCAWITTAILWLLF